MHNELSILQEFSEYIAVADDQIIRLKSELAQLRDENATFDSVIIACLYCCVVRYFIFFFLERHGEILFHLSFVESLSIPGSRTS